MIFSVTRNRQPLDPNLYTWDERTKTFSTNEDGLVLDFSNMDEVTFTTGPNCTFKTKKNCVVVRRDIFEVIQLLEEDNYIKLNGYDIPGYEKIVPKHTIIIDGKKVEISNENYENMKKAFFN